MSEHSANTVFTYHHPVLLQDGTSLQGVSFMVLGNHRLPGLNYTFEGGLTEGNLDSALDNLKKKSVDMGIVLTRSGLIVAA